ncbi:MAG: helix-hairpin-helix domain-containing protein, partial [Oscillospiraceae bacterium]|nr:helix-hairpin-helix domain-containing protein [Oscillospiraceae bacterium]
AEAIQEDTADADLFQDEDTDFTEDSALYDAYFAEEEQDVVSVTFPLDLNTATVDELKFIPQVGDVTAQRIIQYRDHLGGYTQLEQLMEIKGIAEKFFERIEPYLYIGDNDNLEE